MGSSAGRVAAAALCGLAGLIAVVALTGQAADAAKKKKGGTRVLKFQTGGGTIPNAFAIDTNGNGGDFHRGVRVETIRVRKNGKITDLNVGVRLIHARPSELSLILQGPNGRLVFLSEGNDNTPVGLEASIGSYGTGANKCKGKATTFDDDAPLFIDDTHSEAEEDPPSFPDDGGEAVAPYAGRFKPEERTLEGLGTRLRGTWRLFVYDNDPFSGAPEGRLGCFKVIARVKNPRR